MTVFKPVFGFEDYCASIDGQLKRVVPIAGRPALLTPLETQTGYLKYSLRINGAVRTLFAHRAVALAWISPEPEGKPCVAHLDGNRKHNHADNLKWVSYKENESHKSAHGTHLRGSDKAAKKLTEDTVALVRAEYASGASQVKLAAKYSVSKWTIGQALRGLSWAHVAPDRHLLRTLIDTVWNEATESTAVPSTEWADRLIARVFPSAPVSKPKRWYLACQNDGLFIINAEPRPSNDDQWHDRPDGPSIVLNVTELPEAKAIKIVGVMNDITAAPVSGRDAATLEACAQIAKSGAKECTDGDTDWHKGFRYAAHSTALEIESSIRGLSNHKESVR